MVKYLEEVLGFKTIMDTWEQVTELPVYLRSNKEYYLLEIEDQSCIVIKILSQEFGLANFQMQLEKVKIYTNKNIILWLDGVSTYQRQVLIKNKIAFVVPNSQMYVPFLGMYFRERMKNQVVSADKLTAMAQFILLYIIYNPSNEGYTQADIATKLNISIMNVSRGVAELSRLQLVTAEAVGRSKYIKSVVNGKELYELSKGYLQSPIQTKMYVLKENAYMGFMVAGEEALAMKSMLNPPKNVIRALDKKKKSIISQEDIVDPNWVLGDEYIELELWKYNPECLSMDGMVDVISLALSLQSENDERIELEIEGMLDEHQWKSIRD
ncbi:MAG: hypothetical protein R3Y58_06315 [Eubacteriales bacterium]